MQCIVEAIVKFASGTLGNKMELKTWDIVRKEDGIFDMFCQGPLLRGSIPDQWLADQLGRYSFCGQECTDIRRPLDQFEERKLTSSR